MPLPSPSQPRSHNSEADRHRSPPKLAQTLVRPPAGCRTARRVGMLAPPSTRRGALASASTAPCRICAGARGLGRQQLVERHDESAPSRRGPRSTVRARLCAAHRGAFEVPLFVTFGQIAQAHHDSAAVGKIGASHEHDAARQAGHRSARPNSEIRVARMCPRTRHARRRLHRLDRRRRPHRHERRTYRAPRMKACSASAVGGGD